MAENQRTRDDGGPWAITEPVRLKRLLGICDHLLESVLILAI